MTGPQREKNCLCLTGGLAWGASALQRHDAGIGLPQAPASSPASAAEARSLVDYLNLGIVVTPPPLHPAPAPERDYRAEKGTESS